MDRNQGSTVTWLGRRNRRLFLLLLVLCAASFLATALQTYNFLKDRQEFNETAEQGVKDQAKKAAKDIGDRLPDVKSRVAALRDDLASGAISPEELPERLQRDFHGANADSIFEIGVAFDPSAPCTPESPHAPISVGRKAGPSRSCWKRITSPGPPIPYFPRIQIGPFSDFLIS